jgi:hypothetical protein
MNRNTLIILIGLLWASSILGQVQMDVNKVLVTKDFIAFKKYADNLTDRDKRISAYWECLRDLTTDYKEGVLYFKKSVQDKENPAISSVYTFRITLITTEKQIAYYELSEQKNKKVVDNWKPYYETIDKFRDDSAYNDFRKSFQTIFQTDIDESELFVEDFVYGQHCGYAGINPEGQQQIDEFVKNKNKDILLKWLQSTNTEKQIYAIDGLHQLKNLGVKLEGQELKMIQFVMNKNGTMHVCSGCMYSQQEISHVTKKFKF